MTKCGLLQCDSVIEPYRKDFGDFPQLFERFLPDWKWEIFSVIDGKYPSSLSDFDVFLCTGSRHSVYEDLEWINLLKEFVQNLYKEKKKFIGICFGHQILAASLGGIVEKAKTGWCAGIHEQYVMARESWMDPFQTRFQITMMNQDQVTRLPDGAKLLAASSNCPVSMFSIGTQMLGIQGHPELPTKYTEILIEIRREKIGAATSEMAIESLQSQSTNHLIRQWLKNFIRC